MSGESSKRVDTKGKASEEMLPMIPQSIECRIKATIKLCESGGNEQAEGGE